MPNVPLWTMDGAAYTPRTVDKATGSQVVLKAANPQGVTGAVAIRPDTASSSAGALPIVNRDTPAVRVLPGVRTRKFTIAATADNLCGHPP